MKTKLYFILLAILYYPYNIYSQITPGFSICNECTDNYTQNNSNSQDTISGLFTYTDDEYETPDFTSDFGPRRIPGYDWHGGIDYNYSGGSDRGNAINSLEAGTVYAIIGTGLKYIIIDGENDFAYLHMFDIRNTLPVRSGNFVLTHLISDPTEYVIINLGTNTVIGEDACTSCVAYEGDTLDVDNEVLAGQAIGPVGNSPNYDIHLHISRIFDMTRPIGTHTGGNQILGDNNVTDPLEFIDHTGPEYDIKILKRGNFTNIDSFPEGIDLKYSQSGRSTTEILVRPVMPTTPQDDTDGAPYNSVLNISKVELRLANISLNDTFSLIQGPFFRSEIKMGATEDDNIAYPLRIGQSGSAVRRYGRFGFGNVQAKTGLYSFVYRDAGEDHHFYTTSGPRRWDDFYFTDFTTRVHVDDSLDEGGNIDMFADFPDDVRYNDGEYELFARVTNVRDSSFYSDTLSITIDNYMPYINSVTIIPGFFGEYVQYILDWYLTEMKINL